MPQRFRRYELIERIGLGGMAEVFRASGITADGGGVPVVIKKILPSLSDDQQFQEMFVDEARITAQLEHPNIVKLLDLGRMDAQLFLALELVDGIDLQRLLAKIEGESKRLPYADTVFIMAAVLDALDYAHMRAAGGKNLGIVHRDVSPGNVMLARDGAVKLTDFGIAKGANRSGHTMVGAIKGNLRYIAPEQITGGEVGPWSDTYACGMVLYRMVVGRYPIEFDALGTLVGMIVDGSIPRPYEIDASIPKTLEAIISTAISRVPNSRYVRASEFRDELLAWAASANLAPSQKSVAAIVQATAAPAKPVVEQKTAVMPVPPLDVAERQSEDEGTGTVYKSKSYPSGRPLNPFMEPEIVDADVEDVTRKSIVRTPRKTNEITADHLTTDEVKPPFARGLGGEPSQSFVVPDDVPLEGAAGPRRGNTVIEPRRAPVETGFDEDEKTAPTPITRSPLAPPPSDDPSVSRPVVNLASRGDEGSDPRLEWDNMGQPVSKPVPTNTQPSAAPVTPLPTPTVPSAQPLPRTPVGSVVEFAIPVLEAPPPPSLAPPPLSLADAEEEGDSTRATVIPKKTVVSGSQSEGYEETGSTVKSTIPATPAQPPRTPPPLPGRPVAPPPVAAPPTLPEPRPSSTMAIGGFMGHRETVSGIAIAPSSRFVATSSYDKSVRIWDPATRREVRNLQGHEAEVTCVAISPDGRFVASGGRDKMVRVWDPISGSEQFTLPAHEDWIFSVSYSSDGKRLVTSSADRTVRVWDLDARRELLRCSGHGGIVTQVRFLPSWMRQVMSAGYDASLRIWSLVDGSLVRTLGTPKMEGLRALAISPEGAYAFSGGTDCAVRVWDVATGSVDAMPGHTGPVVALASPDGNLLGSGSHDGTVKIWDVGARREMKTLRGHRGSVMALCFSPDGRYLLTGGDDKIIAIWQLGS